MRTGFDMGIERIVEYKKQSELNPEYKLEIHRFKEGGQLIDPNYYVYIFKREYTSHTDNFWLAVNAGSKRKGSGLEFEPIIPPSFAKLDEAIIFGEELLEEYSSSR